MRRTALSGALALVTVALAACSSNPSNSSGAHPSGSPIGAPAAKTLTVGVLTDVTGLASAGEAHIEDGVRAGVYEAAKDGYTIKYVIGDSQSSPTAVLTTAKKLVGEDHVDVVLASSALTFGAARYLTELGIPVVGSAIDGPEWIAATNMFPNAGRTDTTKVATTYAQFAKDQGATTIGSVGYSISPSSAESAQAAAVAGEAIGLKRGYVNSKFPFGSTDVQPVALAMKDAHVDAVFPQVDPNTSFALLAALKGLGAAPKVALLPIGYGGDLLDAGAATLHAADGVYFSLGFQPIEMNTPGTRRFLAALKATGGTQTPGLATYTGYTSILLLVKGLKNVTGSITDKQAIIGGLGKVHAFDAGGLLDKPVDPADLSNVLGPNNCTYVVQITGDAFHVVPKADPVCGTVLAGKMVSP